MRFLDTIEDYEVSNGSITLNITIGDGKQGFIIVDITTDESDVFRKLGEGVEIENLDIGKGKEIKNRQLNVRATVSNVHTDVGCPRTPFFGPNSLPVFGPGLITLECPRLLGLGSGHGIQKSGQADGLFWTA